MHPKNGQKKGQKTASGKGFWGQKHVRSGDRFWPGTPQKGVFWTPKKGHFLTPFWRGPGRALEGPGKSSDFKADLPRILGPTGPFWPKGPKRASEGVPKMGHFGTPKWPFWDTF